MEQEMDGFGNYMVELVDLMSEDQQGEQKRQILENGNHRTRDTRETQPSLIEEQKTFNEEVGPVTSILMSREF
jgi:hypothetical protein